MKLFKILTIIVLSLIFALVSCKKKKKHDIKKLPSKVEIFSDTSYVKSTIKDSALIKVKSFGNKFDSLIYASDLDTIATYLKKIKSNEIYQTPTGVIYIINEYGYGDYAIKGDKMHVNSLGTLLNDKKIFSTYDYKEPLEFVLGVGQVIPAWDEVLPNLPVGTKATIISPSATAYAQYRMGKYLPPNAILKFDIEVVKVISKSKIEKKVHVDKNAKITLDKKEIKDAKVPELKKPITPKLSK